LDWADGGSGALSGFPFFKIAHKWLFYRCGAISGIGCFSIIFGRSGTAAVGRLPPQSRQFDLSASPESAGHTVTPRVSRRAIPELRKIGGITGAPPNRKAFNAANFNVILHSYRPLHSRMSVLCIWIKTLPARTGVADGLRMISTNVELCDSSDIAGIVRRRRNCAPPRSDRPASDSRAVGIP
jgi:hypothetical protein